MPRGAFITLEGGEGVGKSSSLTAVENFLRQAGVEVITTREPGGTDLGEAVRRWLLDGEHENLSAESEALLMFAARSVHLDQVIRPAVERGAWVVCDRFTDATIAYQGGGRGARREFLLALRDEVQQGFGPDLTILLDAPVEVGFARIADRTHDHFERESGAFFSRVRQAYLDLAVAEPERIRVINADASPDEVKSAIESALGDFMHNFDACSRAAS
ncbi:MAG TPA: dTMP kinase [Gammaproteobacteria bacterium]|jgi:dTMP kinase